MRALEAPAFTDRPLRLLLVEDNPNDAMLTARMVGRGIREAGSTLDHASSFAEALQRLEQTSYDVLLFDQQLGNRTGIELLREVRQRGLDAPVIFLTGHGDEELAVQAMKAGACDYLSKSKLNESSLARSIRYGVKLHQKEALLQRAESKEKRAQEALQRSERQYQMLFESANDAILIFEPGGTILEANSKACQLYGYGKEELVGMSWSRLNRNADQANAQFNQFARMPNCLELETVHSRKDGSKLDVVASWSLVEYQGRRAILSINRDVSERKQAEEEVRRLNRALKALSKCSQALARATDETELLNVVCRTVVQVGGYRFAWVGFAEENQAGTVRPVAQAGHEAGCPQQAQISWNQEQERGRGPAGTALRTGKIAVVRNTLLDPSFAPWREEAQRRGYASCIALPLLAAGKAFGTFNICSGERDVFDAAEVELLSELASNLEYGILALRTRAEHRQAEEKLRKLSSAVEQSADVVVITNREGVIEYVNPAFETLTGYRREEALGNKPGMLRSGVQDARFYRQLWETILAGKAFRGVLVNRRKNGELYHAEKTITPVRDKHGRVTHFISNDRDITDQRRLEEQLLQAQKMDAVGQLAGGLAHDFNNLLMVISSYAELMLDALGSDHHLNRNVQQILKAARRAADLTRQLLAFSRKQVQSLRVLDLNAVIQEIGKMLPRLIGEDVQLVLALEKGLAKVKADPVQVEQVIMNLAANARDAMPHGGRLTVQTCNVKLEQPEVGTHALVPPGKYVLLAAGDSGEGIDPAVLPRIFEPFFTTKEQGKGTGLGLATVYGIVKQSGGHILVDSKPGAGTVFRIYLPQVEQAENGDEPDKAVTTTTGGTETLLLVEDEESVRESAREYLERRGYTVLTATNGVEALQVAEKHEGQIELVVTDVVMPQMSGSELGRQLLARRPGTSVLYVSGYAEKTVLQHGIDRGEVFLQKPFTLKALAQKVREVLDAAPFPS